MILKKFQMLDAKLISIPIPHGAKLVKFDTQEESSIDPKIYQSKVGSLMYAMLCTRPDLAYAVSQISQFNHHPSEEHDATANRIFKYLRGTSNLGITFDGKVGLEMKAYSDANWEERWIGSQWEDICFVWQVEQYLGQRRNSRQSRFRQRNLSTWH